MYLQRAVGPTLIQSSNQSGEESNFLELHPLGWAMQLVAKRPAVHLPCALWDTCGLFVFRRKWIRTEGAWIHMFHDRLYLLLQSTVYLWVVELWLCHVCAWVHGYRAASCCCHPLSNPAFSAFCTGKVHGVPWCGVFWLVPGSTLAMQHHGNSWMLQPVP